MNEKMIPNLYQSQTSINRGPCLCISPLSRSTDNRTPNKAYFSFEQTKELTDLIPTYWRGELRIEPKTYLTSYEPLRLGFIARHTMIRHQLILELKKILEEDYKLQTEFRGSL